MEFNYKILQISAKVQKIFDFENTNFENSKIMTIFVVGRYKQIDNAHLIKLGNYIPDYTKSEFSCSLSEIS